MRTGITLFIGFSLRRERRVGSFQELLQRPLSKEGNSPFLTVLGFRERH
jgi:hypothetical protein